MFRIKNKNSGQTIIEATIALASILLVLTAISIAIAISLSNSQFIKSQSLAAKYAQEGMEYIRFLRNTNPTTFESREGIYCMNEDNVFTAGSCQAVNVAGTFKRESEFTQDSSPDCNGGAKVTVTVYWASGKCDSQNRFCHKSQLVSCFSDNSDSGNSL